MPKPKARKAVSQRQARFLGAVAGGKTKSHGLSKSEAKDMLRGVNVTKLPKRSKKGR